MTEIEFNLVKPSRQDGVYIHTGIQPDFYRSRSLSSRLFSLGDEAEVRNG